MVREMSDELVVASDEPNARRRAELESAYETNIAAGQSPYAGVIIGSDRELQWVLTTRAWDWHSGAHDRSPADFSEATFKYVNMQGLTLPKAKFRSASFMSVNMRNASFEIGDFRSARFQDVSFESTELTEADFRDADLGGVSLGGMSSDPIPPVVSLKGTTLVQAKFAGAKCAGADFSHVRAWYADMSGVDLRHARLVHADLQHATLAAANLHSADMTGAKLLHVRARQAVLNVVKLTSADLSYLDFSGGDFGGADLTGAELREADFSETSGMGAKLEGAHLYETNLTNARLARAKLRKANLQGASLNGANLRGADLRGALLHDVRMDANTVLADIQLDTDTSLADVGWNGAPLTRVPWSTVPELGDELAARRFKTGFERAMRANQQLAVTLRAQGLNDEADRYAYKAQCLRRDQYWQREHRSIGKWMFWWVLWGIAGYGYRPGRTLAVYGTVLLFSTLVFTSQNLFFAPQTPIWNALGNGAVEGITALHGRGFFAGTIHGGVQVAMAAFDAVAGLIIEASFIATFVQRFFGR